jgi:hypothetical protein
VRPCHQTPCRDMSPPAGSGSCLHRTATAPPVAVLCNEQLDLFAERTGRGKHKFGLKKWVRLAGVPSQLLPMSNLIRAQLGNRYDLSPGSGSCWRVTADRSVLAGGDCWRWGRRCSTLPGCRVRGPGSRRANLPFGRWHMGLSAHLREAKDAGPLLLCADPRHCPATDLLTTVRRPMRTYALRLSVARA